MIADVMLGSFKLEANDDAWFEDRARVQGVIDAILDTPLGSLMKFAGIFREAKPAPDRAAIHALVATGREETYTIQDAKVTTRAGLKLTITYGVLGLELRVFEPELSARRATVLDDIAAIGAAARASGVFKGLALGWIRPMSLKHVNYEPDRAGPRARQRAGALRPAAIVDLIDVGFHAGGSDLAVEAECALARAPLPAGVNREERDGLVVIRWVEDPTDKAALDRACEAHEQWLAQHLPAG